MIPFLRCPVTPLTYLLAPVVNQVDQSSADSHSNLLVESPQP